MIKQDKLKSLLISKSNRSQVRGYDTPVCILCTCECVYHYERERQHQFFNQESLMRWILGQTHTHGACMLALFASISTSTMSAWRLLTNHIIQKVGAGGHVLWMTHPLSHPSPFPFPLSPSFGPFFPSATTAFTVSLSQVLSHIAHSRYL